MLLKLFSAFCVFSLHNAQNIGINIADVSCLYSPPIRFNGDRFCAGPTSRLLIGDFDGDRNSDLLCHDLAKERFQQIKNMRQSSYRKSRYCNEKTTEIYAHDFDGDGKDDVMCRKKDGTMKIYFYSRQAWQFLKKKCIPSRNNLLFGDYDNNNKQEIICRHGNHFEFVFVDKLMKSRVMNISFCEGNESRLFTGKFNRDGRVDFLCYEHKINTFQILLSPYGERAVEKLSFKQCYKKDAVIRLADLNGDGIDDVICVQPTDPKIHILFSTKGRRKFTHKTEPNFCYNGGERNFFVGNFNGDRKDDMLCQTMAGLRQVALSYCKS